MLKIFIFLACLIFCLSCTTIPVNTDPAQAKIYVNEEYIGLSPIEIEPGEMSRSVRIKIEKDGYKTIDQIVAKGRSQVSLGTMTQTAYARNSYGGSASAYGFGNGMLMTAGQWPDQLFFKLEKIDTTHPQQKYSQEKESLNNE